MSIEAMKQWLEPCPFCGSGTTEIRENGKMWSGRGWSEPSSVSVFHWCEEVKGQPSRAIERVGKDLDSAVKAWNLRQAIAEAELEEKRKLLPRCFSQKQEQGESVAYDKTELNCFAKDLYEQKMREGKHGHYESMFHVIHQCVKKVSSPQPQRKPLTDEQIAELLYKFESASAWYQFARAIEAAHNIKEQK